MKTNVKISIATRLSFLETNDGKILDYSKNRDGEIIPAPYRYQVVVDGFSDVSPVYADTVKPRGILQVFRTLTSANKFARCARRAGSWNGASRLFASL